MSAKPRKPTCVCDQRKCPGFCDLCWGTSRPVAVATWGPQWLLEELRHSLVYRPAYLALMAVWDRVYALRPWLTFEGWVWVSGLFSEADDKLLAAAGFEKRRLYNPFTGNKAAVWSIVTEIHPPKLRQLRKSDRKPRSKKSKSDSRQAAFA